jgi:hypothetical protein
MGPTSAFSAEEAINWTMGGEKGEGKMGSSEEANSRWAVM